MEPDFVREQVKNVWRVAEANAKLISDRNLAVEGALVDYNFIRNQVAALHDATADSVQIQTRRASGPPHEFVTGRPEFLSQQAKALQIAIEDNGRIQRADMKASIELVGMGDAFVRGIVTNLRDVVNDNAAVAVAWQIQQNAMFMCTPSFVSNLAMSFHTMLDRLLDQRTVTTALQERAVAAEHANATLKAQMDEAAVRSGMTASMVDDFRKETELLQGQCEKLKADANSAADIAQARISQLEEELACLVRNSAMEDHGEELAALEEEHKVLVREHEMQRDVATEIARQLQVVTDEKLKLQLDHDQLAAELARVRQEHENLNLASAHERDQLMSEVTRLEAALQTRQATANSLAEENSQLKVALAAAKEELLRTTNQLSATIIQCDTWKASLDDMVSRQAADHGAIQEVAANEREVANGLLTNAAKKIEELENQLRQKDLEIITLHETSARGSQRPAFAPAVNLPASPPPSSRKRSSLEDEKADILMSTCSWELNLAAHGSPLPPDRTEELASLPEVEVTLGPGHTIPAIFSRQSVSNALGGSIQGLVVRCTESATPLARKHGIQDYLCPNMDHNAWSPAGPGKHGFIQVGLGRDRKLFNGEGDYRHVFVGAGKHLIYCGWYHVLRVEPLTKDEWETLPAKVKSTYSETTMSKEKNRELKSAQNVLRMYNSGELRAPCVRLQCVKFDTEFYHELVRANDQFFEHKPRPTPQTRSVGVKMSKRRKVIKSNAEVDMDVESSEDEVSLAVALRVRNATSSQFATAMSVAPSSAQSPVPALPPPDATAIPVDPAPTAPLTPAASRSSVATAAVDCASSPFSAGSSVVSLTVGRRQTMSSTKSQSVPSDTQPGPMKIRIPGGRAAPAPSLSLDEREDPDQYLVESLSESDSDDMYADDLVYKRLSSS